PGAAESGPGCRTCRKSIGRSGSHPLRAALDGDDAGARDLDQAEWNHQVDEALYLLGGAGDLEHEALGAGVDDAGAERVGEPQRLDPIVALAAYLHHSELALDRRTGHGHVDHPMHRHQPLELILDLLDHHRSTAGDDGDAREVLLVLGLRDGERVDVVAATGEQADDTREHARLVVDDDGKRMRLNGLGSGRGRVMGGAHGVPSFAPRAYVLRNWLRR